jgi:hypothetical protein
MLNLNSDNTGAYEASFIDPSTLIIYPPDYYLCRCSYYMIMIQLVEENNIENGGLNF